MAARWLGEKLRARCHALQTPHDWRRHRYRPPSPARAQYFAFAYSFHSVPPYSIAAVSRQFRLPSPPFASSPARHPPSPGGGSAATAAGIGSSGSRADLGIDASGLLFPPLGYSPPTAAEELRSHQSDGRSLGWIQFPMGLEVDGGPSGGLSSEGLADGERGGEQGSREGAHAKARYAYISWGERDRYSLLTRVRLRYLVSLLQPI